MKWFEVRKIGRVKLMALCLVAAVPMAAHAGDDGVKSAIDALHAAIESRDIAKMEPVWAHDAQAMLLNPRDNKITIGWDGVRSGWLDTFHRIAEIKITQVEGPHVDTKGDVAWSLGVAHVVLTLASGDKLDFHYAEVDVLERQGDRWVIASHVARPIGQ